MRGNNKKEDKRINTYHAGIYGQGSKLAITACEELCCCIFTPCFLQSCERVTLVMKQSD